MVKNLLRLLHLVHCNASLECRRKGFEVLNTIFTNIIEHSSEDRYKRINMSSLMWARYIAPTFYVFSLVEWLETLGFEQDTERSLLYFRGSELSELERAQEEVRVLLGACVSSRPTEKDGNDSEGQKQLIPLLRVVTGLSDEKELVDDLPLKNKAATENYLPKSVWDDIKIYLRLVVLWSECIRQGHHQFSGMETVLQPQLPSGRFAAWLLLVEVTRGLTLSQLDEDLAVVDAEIFGACQESANSCSDNRSVWEENARKRVAERHKNSLFSQPSNSVKVHAEVKLVATRLIADIASCIEQIAILEDEQGIVRKDRLEGWKLLDKFNQDGDILYLHSLKEEWTQRLEATKEKYGRPFVYL